MQFKEKILNLLASNDYTPQRPEEIMQTLRIDKSHLTGVKGILTHLQKNGVIAKVKAGRYVMSKDAELASGMIKFKPSGKAVLIPDSSGQLASAEPIPIRAQDTANALNKDRVLVKLYNKFPRGKRPDKSRPLYPTEYTFARVKHVLERNNDRVTGTLQRGRTSYYVVPDDPTFVQWINVNGPSATKLKPKPKLGDKVVVKLLDWENRNRPLEGKVISVLGKTHTPMAEYEAILLKFKLSPTFPDAVMKQVKSVPDTVQKKAIKNRMDCRDLFTLTIDPDDAKDFDDALSLEELKGGKTRVGIHIADVCEYVKRDTALDKEAKKRGNSTYLVGTVIPMLPHALSNGICSLVEAQDRLTKSVFLTFDKDGNIESTDFANTVICSNKRLTYHQAYTFMTESDIGTIAALPLPPAHQTGSTGRALSELSGEELKKIQKTIKKLWEFASKMRGERMSSGSLNFDMPEVKIFVDEAGHADRIETVDNDESHQLIEEFMLAANEAVALHLHRAKMPFISRVHDKPDPEKLSELRQTLLSHGIRTGDLTQRSEIVKFLDKIRDHSQSYAMKIQFLRSLKQACYRAAAEGHYGLHKEFYTHFTSPIRRYSDLVTHRVFDNFLTKHAYDTAPKDMHKSYTQSQLVSLAEHISLTEQNSTEAERESVKVKLLEYFYNETQKPKKTPLEGVIVDVRNYALFVELTESLAFGLVHLSSLQDDIYKQSLDGNAIIGRKSGRMYTLGQKVTVNVDRVDRFKRQIDFVLADNKNTERTFKEFKKSTEKVAKRPRRSNRRQTRRK